MRRLLGLSSVDGALQGPTRRSRRCMGPTGSTRPKNRRNGRSTSCLTTSAPLGSRRSLPGCRSGCAMVRWPFSRRRNTWLISYEAASFSGAVQIPRSAKRSAASYRDRRRDAQQAGRPPGRGIRTARAASFVSTISVGAVDTELQFGSSDAASADTVRVFYKKTAIPADSVACAIAFAIEQPAEVDVNEIVLRPTVQEFRQRPIPDVDRPLTPRGHRCLLSDPYAVPRVRRHWVCPAQFDRSPSESAGDGARLDRILR